MNKKQKERIKKLLSNYKTMKAQIECTDYEIELLKEHIEFLKGLRDEESSIIESNKEIEHKRAIKKRIEECINSIDKVLNKMSDTERKIIELRYLEGEKHTWKEICSIVGYSEIYCRKELMSKIFKIKYNS